MKILDKYKKLNNFLVEEQSKQKSFYYSEDAINADKPNLNTAVSTEEVRNALKTKTIDLFSKRLIEYFANYR